VWCVDEKSQIQALDRTQPGLPLKKGRSGTMTHGYKRNGATTLFAALMIAAGRVNCASIPKDLFESEFSGHTRGAFTGAVKDRAGRFEAAEGGTLFLDEIGEVPLDLQSQLLRVLQEKSYERAGEDRTRQADVRVIAATNRNLEQAVAAGRLREDLYYRLNVFPIQVPPLRERMEDVALLAKHFIETSVRELGCPKPRLTRAGIAKLQNYHWPGNIRELRNVIERASIISRGGTLDFDLPVTEWGQSPFTTKQVLIMQKHKTSQFKALLTTP